MNRVDAAPGCSSSGIFTTPVHSYRLPFATCKPNVQLSSRYQHTGLSNLAAAQWQGVKRTVQLSRSHRCRALFYERLYDSGEWDDEDSEEEEEPIPLTEEEREAFRLISLQEYGALKVQLQQRTQRFSSFLALYLLLVASGEIAACSIVGSVVGYGYLLLLIRDVDAVQGTDPMPMEGADRMPEGLLRNAARVAVAYSQSLRPRLLSLVGLAAAVYAYNVNADLLGARPLTLIEQGAVLGGFLSFKVALILQVYDELKPKFEAEKLLQASRPVLAEVEDVSVDLKTLLAPDDGKANKKQAQ